ncbi:MAG: hypothetical protein HYX61_10135 [Gammaproteobacteria bacterium]|jgi:hypothetical protein|nr:hypothetical protein [Gammaproteobacteria bacterium]
MTALFPFEENYIEAGVNVEHFWLIYELLYSPNANDAARGLKMVQALPYKEDIELFEAFKNDADSTAGTIGYQCNQLFRFQREQERLRAEKKNIAEQKQELLNNQANLLEQRLNKSPRP